MKREFLKAIEGLTDEAIDKIMAENGKDIEAAKGKIAETEKKVTELTDQLTKAQTTITELEKSKGDATALQAEIDKYKQAEIDRAEAEKKTQARAEVEGRFDKAAGERKFAHEYIRSGVLADFEKALADATNKGKGDVELFDALTKDKEGLFASQNPVDKPNMGGMGNGGSLSEDDKLSDADYYAKYMKKGDK